MNLGLQTFLIERYSKKNDIILDPMFGSGTLLVACALGRHVIGIELEQKFVDMAKANWEKIESLGPILGYRMGTATIIQGDARQLPEVLADVCCFSPPFAAQGTQLSSTKDGKIPLKAKRTNPRRVGERLDWTEYAKNENPNNISNLKYGEIDKVIMSPPYEGSATGKEGGGIDWSRNKEFKTGTKGTGMAFQYSETKENIGNLKSTNYLEAMAQVYQGCHRVLRDEGLMILVVKSFIRNKKIVDLAADTINLCEQAGFRLKERLKRKLPAQSFWRIIYYKKYPHVPKIEFEDCLIFQKC